MSEVRPHLPAVRLPADDPPPAAWQRAWRAIAQVLSIQALDALRNALLSDDKRLLQGVTSDPPALQCLAGCPIKGGCAITFAGWQGEGLRTVADADEFFAKTCFAVDTALGEPAACRYFLNEYDSWDRQEMRRLLTPEVNREIYKRLTRHVAEALAI
jgi:hypothetical protein